MGSTQTSIPKKDARKKTKVRYTWRPDHDKRRKGHSHTVDANPQRRSAKKVKKGQLTHGVVKIWKRKGRVTHSLPQTTEQEKVRLSHGVVTTTRQGRVTHRLSTGGFDANPRTRSNPKQHMKESKGQYIHGVVSTTKEGRFTHFLSQERFANP